jgi:hypothetical protein
MVASAGALAGEWLDVAPAGTACADGSPWQFWYSPGVEDDLVLWFQGGGACWRADLCDADAEPAFDGRVDAHDHPARSAGLFDARRSDNPLHGWRVLFVPYCTGDVHIGRATVDYTRADGSTFRVAHEGQRNVRAALDWLASRLIAEGRPPPRILVGGESAGAIAAAYWAYEIGDRWPKAELAVVGDAAGGYRSAGVSTALRQWGVLDALPTDVPAYADPDKVYFETFYIAASQRHPRARLGQVNFADDAVQRRFMGFLGTPTDVLTKGLTCNLNEIRVDSPNFHSFIHPGSAHAVLRTSAVYDTACEGERLVDWIRALIDGRPVQNRWCDGTAGTFAGTNVPRL